MAFTYEPTTTRGQVRMLIPDIDWQEPIFQDAEIDGYLALEGSDVRLAAALALETLASSQAYVQKVVTVGDVKTDGAALAKELRARAATLRDQADQQAAFDWAEMVTTPFAARERYLNQVLRESV